MGLALALSSSNSRESSRSSRHSTKHRSDSHSRVSGRKSNRNSGRKSRDPTRVSEKHDSSSSRSFSIGSDGSLSPRRSSLADDRRASRLSLVVTSNIAKGKNFFNSLPRIVQLFLLYFCLGILAGIGGFFFCLVEKPAEARVLEQFGLAKHAVYNSTYDFTDEDLGYIEEWSKVMPMYHNNNKWILRYSAFFAAVTFTTCGYGFQSPATFAGQIMVLLYGLPAIILFTLLAKKIGTLCFHYIQKLYTLCMNVDTYRAWRVYILFATITGCAMGMTALVRITAMQSDGTGFGKGIDRFSDAWYFMFQTTLTIGYGDVLMSGGNPIITLFIGLWLASFLGMFFACTEVANTSMVRKTSRLLSFVEEESRDSLTYEEEKIERKQHGDEALQRIPES